MNAITNKVSHISGGLSDGSSLDTKDKKDLLKYSPSDFNFSEQLPRCLRNEGEFLTALKFESDINTQ